MRTEEAAMSRTKAKPKPRTAREPVSNPVSATAPAPVAAAPAAAPNGDVFTLTDAAAYLRLPERVVEDLVYTQGLPGRRMGVEWRFLKSAIQDWLKISSPPMSEKEVWESVAGIWKDDPTVP